MKLLSFSSPLAIVPSSIRLAFSKTLSTVYYLQEILN